MYDPNKEYSIGEEDFAGDPVDFSQFNGVGDLLETENGLITINPALVGDFVVDEQGAPLGRVVRAGMNRPPMYGGARLPFTSTSKLPTRVLAGKAATAINAATSAAGNTGVIKFVSARNAVITLDPVGHLDSAPLAWLQANISRAYAYSINPDESDQDAAGTSSVLALASGEYPRLIPLLVIEFMASQANAVPGGLFEISIACVPEWDSAVAAAVTETLTLGPIGFRVQDANKPVTLIVVPWKVASNTAFPILARLDYHATTPRLATLSYTSYPSTSYQGRIVAPGPKHPAIMSLSKPT